MFRLVSTLLKVQVMRDRMLLVRRKQADSHVELAPSFLFDSERRRFER